LDQVQEVFVDRLSLALVQTEKSDVSHGRPIEKALHHRGKRLLHAFPLDPPPGAVKGMQDEPSPSFLGRQGKASPHGARGSFPAELKVLSHHGAMNDRRERQSTGFGHDHVPLSDRALPHSGELDFISCGLFDRQCRPGRHPEIVVRWKEEGIRLGPAGWPILNIDPRLDKVK
jgi:hypothetical protein